MLSLTARAFWIPKEGNRIEEWEDACAFSETRRCIALSDGASSSFRAHDWADILVTQFLEAPPPSAETDALEAWLGTCAKQFDALPLPNGDAWYVDEAASRGAFATLVGFAVGESKGSGPAPWTALAVGDTCVFQIRDGRRICAFPLDDPDVFDTTPPLLASTERSQGRGARAALVHRATCQSGDVFLFATDALAKWALQAEREDLNVWDALSTIRNEGFLSLITTLRGAHAIDNDDVTLVRAVMKGRR